MQTIALALYLDLENLPKGLDFDLLMGHAAGEGLQPFYAVKAAYGSAAALSKTYRQHLLDHNFQIVDTPHVTGKKNRADLIISVDAFERLHVGSPPIDRYVFVTGDSDFSVIMDRLRAYGKQVWLVCRKADRAKRILVRCCDRMLFLESFVPGRSAAAAPASPVPLVLGRNVDPAKHHQTLQLFQQALREIGPSGLPIVLPALGSRMRRLQPGFEFRSSGFKRLTELAAHFEKTGLIRLGVTDKGVRQIEDMDDSQLEANAPCPSVVQEPVPARSAPASKTAVPKNRSKSRSSAEDDCQVLSIQDARPDGKRQAMLAFGD